MYARLGINIALCLFLSVGVAAQGMHVQECEGPKQGHTGPTAPCSSRTNDEPRHTPLRKDIPTIAKAASGAVVTIFTAVGDKPVAQGTGFLVSPDGVIVTNYHVIENGNIAVIKLSNGKTFPVEGLLAGDKVRDLAIIKIQGNALGTLTLGDSDDVQVGEEVVAIGNPLSLESTVSNGIISGVRTSKEQGGKFLQTTAPISPGSSGGPLFNMRGEVIGINALYLEGGENLNFAIPVNDAKVLLSHQSAKLQNLPDERMSASMDAPPSANAEAPIARTNQPKGTYFVRSGRNETYLIEYKGHQLTAHCREALSWLDGEDKLGRPLAEQECVYMGGQIGKYISEDLIVREDNELRFRPLADVADVLDITDDTLIGGHRHPHALPKTSPDIQNTLHWIQNTLNDEEGETLHVGKNDDSYTTRINLMPELNGCLVTFVYETREDTKGESKVTYRTRNLLNLGDLDPTSLTSNSLSRDILGNPISIVGVYTTDKRPSISLAINDRTWAPAHVISTTDLVWELPSPYAERFVKALHQAITLCGGKASTF